MKALNTKMLDDQDQLILESSNSAPRLEDELNMAKELDGLQIDSGDTAAAAASIHSLSTEVLPSPDLRKTKSMKGARKTDGGGGGAATADNRSDVECDDDYFVESSSPALARAMSTPPKNKFRRFHSNPGGGGRDVADNISLMDELAGSLPCLDKSKPLPFPEASVQYSSGSDDDDDDERNGGGDPLRQYQKNRFSNPVFHRQASLLQSTSTTGPVSCGGDSAEFNSMNTRSSDYGASGAPQYVLPLSQVKAAGGSSVDSGTSIREPERVFKVIFIGDSSVGKSSLITRFCTGKFKPGLKSTIGVDFHTRSLVVEDQSICLQCWDTAGQERYRSITRQYFRKADAVVIVYDISSEKSFLNARDWLESAVEGAGPGASLLLLGNKLDIAEDDLLRYVVYARMDARCNRSNAIQFQGLSPEGRQSPQFCTVPVCLRRRRPIYVAQHF